MTELIMNYSVLNGSSGVSVDIVKDSDGSFRTVTDEITSEDI